MAINTVQKYSHRTKTLKLNGVIRSKKTNKRMNKQTKPNKEIIQRTWVIDERFYKLDKSLAWNINGLITTPTKSIFTRLSS